MRFHRLFRAANARAATPPLRPAARLSVERLEDRVVPTNTPTNLLDGLRRTVDDAVGSLVSQAIKDAQATLPVINTKIRDLQTGVETAIDAVTNGIKQIVTGNDSPSKQTRQNLTTAFNPAVPDAAARNLAASALQSALAPYAQNVQVTDLRPADGVAVVLMDLVAPLADRTVSLGTALPALPVQLGQAQVALSSSLRFEGVRVGLQNDKFYFQADASRTDELKLTLDAGLASGTTFKGEIGFLSGDIKVNPAGVGLHGVLAADVSNGKNGPTVSSPRFVGLAAVADLQLTAAFAPPQEDKSNPNEPRIAPPKFRTDFRLDWDLSGASPTAAAANLGGVPRVSFNKVSIELGSLVSNTITPIVKTIQQMTGPIQPIFDALGAPLPVLSDVGLGKVSVLKLAQLIQSSGTLPPDIDLITKMTLQAAKLYDIVSRIKNIGKEVYIDFGDYNLTGPDGEADLRKLQDTAQQLKDLFANKDLNNLSKLKGLLQTGALTLRERIDQIRDKIPEDLQAPVSSWLDQTDLMNKMGALGNGVILSYPFIDDPTQGVIKILLGQADDVKFVDFKFDFIQRTPEMVLLDFPVWGPIHGDVRGSINMELHFGARYDAQGLRDFMAALFNPNAPTTDLALFGHGLAFDSRTTNKFAEFKKDLIHVTANMSAGVYLPYGFQGVQVTGPNGFPAVAEARVGPRGSLGGNVGLRLTDPSSKGEVRPIAAPIGSRPAQLFEAEGRLDAAVKLLLEAWLLGKKFATLKEWPLLDKNLFDIKDIDTSNPFRPPAQPGAFADFQRFNEVFSVRSNGGRNTGPASDVLVRMNGDRVEVYVNRELRQTYNRLTTLSLTLIGTRYNDNFVVRNIPVDIHVSGAFSTDITQGYDTLTLDDRMPWLAPDMTYNVAADRVTRVRYTGQIPSVWDTTYTAIDDVRLVAPSRENFINVNALPPVPFTIQTTPQFLPFLPSMSPRPTYDPTIESRFPAKNTIRVNGSALDRDGAFLTIDGQSGADFVTVQENLPTFSTYYTVSADRVVREGNDGDFQPYRVGTLRYVSVDKLDIVDQWYGNQGRTYRVVGLNPATPLTITGAGGNDEFTLGGSLDVLSGSDVFHVMYLALTGGGGYDTLAFDDTLNTDAATVDANGNTVPAQVISPAWYVNGSSMRRENTVRDLQLGLTSSYYLDVGTNGFERVSIAGSGGSDLFVVESTLAGQSLAVYGMAGDDALYAGGFFTVDGLNGPLSFDGGTGADRLNVSDVLAGRNFFFGNRYEVLADQVTARGHTVGYARVEDVNLSTSAWEDVVAVLGVPAGTTLSVAAGGGDDFVTVGYDRNFRGGPGLSLVRGPVRVDGGDGIDNVVVSDDGQPVGQSFVITDTAVTTDGGTTVNYAAIEYLRVEGGPGADLIHIRSTAPGMTTTVSGGANDTARVTTTTGPLAFTADGSLVIEIGTATSSLDNIQGPINITPTFNSSLTLRLNDTAATMGRDLLVNGTDSGQRYQRTNVRGSGEWRTLVEVLFSPLSGASVKNFEYFSGSGGSTMYVNSTTAGTTSNFHGHAGSWDIFALGFGTDLNQILGSIFVAGQTADSDFAYYYDFLNPNPQTYDFGALFSTMYCQRPGIGVAAFEGLQQIIFYAPRVGGNVENVRSVTPGTALGLVVGSDTVTIGTSVPNLGRSLAGIQGPVVVGGYADSNVRLIVDNSGNQTTGYQGVSLSRRQGQYDPGNRIHGFAPAEILWNFSGASTVELRGGAADEVFTVQNGLLNQISIDGGTGSSILQSEGGVPAKFTFTGHNAGRLYDNVQVTGIQSFYGTDADDQFSFLSGATIDGGIDGFGGTNTLDYSGVQGAAGEVSRYRADGNALDAVGDNHGTIHRDVTFVQGRVGQAFDFDGAGDYVDLGNDASLNLPGSMSVSLWVRLETLDHYKYLFADFNPGGGTSQGALGVGNYGVPGAPAGGNWPFWFQAYTDGTHDFLFGTTPIELGEWYHLSIVRDDAAKIVRLYVNGVEEGMISYAGKTVVPLQSGKLLGGSGTNFPADFMDGQLDEVSVFNRALSAAEVQARFDAAVAGEPSSGPGVYVNLQTGQATGVAGAINHIQNVIGSAGDDILVGNGGNALFGGVGRDLLSAGALASQLYGGGDEDVLIGGTLNDSSRANLDAVMAEWTRTGDGNDYAARVARLRAGLLADGTMTGNGGGNTLTGEGGLDQFFGPFVTDWQVDDGERVFPL